MKTKIVILLFSLVIAAGASGAELTVYAVVSLTDAMKEIGPAYEKESADKFVFNCGESKKVHQPPVFLGR